MTSDDIPAPDGLIGSIRTNAAWLSTSSESGASCMLSGTPVTEGVYWVNITISDDNSTDCISYTITVSESYGDSEVPGFSGAFIPAALTLVVIATLVLVRKRMPSLPRYAWSHRPYPVCRTV